MYVPEKKKKSPRETEKEGGGEGGQRDKVFKQKINSKEKKRERDLCAHYGTWGA